MRLLHDYSYSFANGLNDSASFDRFREDEVRRLVNGRVSLQGDKIVRRRGSARLSRPFLENPILALTEFYTAAGQQQIIMVSDNGLNYSTDGGITFTNAGSVGTADRVPTGLVTIREGASNVLCIASGDTNSYQWDGTTLSTISNIPNNTRYLAVHGDRLIAAGGDNIRVAASKVGDIDTWAAPDGWVVDAKTHDGDTEITGLFSLGSVIMVFKNNSVGYIEGFGYQTLQVETGARGLSRSIGCVAPRSINRCGDNGVMWLSERGFEYYALGAQEPVLISRRQQAVINSIAWGILKDYAPSNTYTTGKQLPDSLWWPAAQEYWCSIPVGVLYGSDAAIGIDAGCSHIYVFRPPTGDAPMASWLLAAEQDDRTNVTEYTFGINEQGVLVLETTGDGMLGATIDDNGALCLVTPPGLGSTPIVSSITGLLQFVQSEWRVTSLGTADRPGMLSAPLIGSLNGYVNEAETKDGPDDGTDVRMTVRFKPFTFGLQGFRKKMKRIHLQTAQEYTGTVDVTNFVDGVAQSGHTIPVAAVTGEGPHHVSARVGGRGYVHEVEIETTDQVTVHAVEVFAGAMEDPI